MPTDRFTLELMPRPGGRIRQAEKLIRERAALDAFLTAYGAPHDAPIPGKAGEEPDFLVQFSTGRVGIEVTNDVWRPRRHVEESRKEVVARARQIYMSRSPVPLLVAIHWADDGVQQDRADTANRIAEVVENIAPHRDSGDSEVEDYRLYHLGLPGLYRIGVHRDPRIRRNDWSSPDAGGVRVIGPDRIREVIEKKEKLHQAFLDRSEGWLFVYTFEAAISESSGVSEDAARATYETKFSKVFALTTWSKKLVEFHVAQAGPGGTPPASSRPPSKA